MIGRLSASLAAGILVVVVGCMAQAGDPGRGTADLGIVVERAAGRVQIIETTSRTRVGEIGDLGDLSHASANFSRDGRFAFVFGRDGGLSKLDLLAGELVARVVQAGNSIGGAISDDGTLVAVSNYQPGGVKVFDSKSLEPVANIPAIATDGTRSRVVGLVDAPGQRFVLASTTRARSGSPISRNGHGRTSASFPASGRSPTTRS
jgi:protein NirF